VAVVVSGSGEAWGGCSLWFGGWEDYYSPEYCILMSLNHSPEYRILMSLNYSSEYLIPSSLDYSAQNRILLSPKYLPQYRVLMSLNYSPEYRIQISLNYSPHTGAGKAAAAVAIAGADGTSNKAREPYNPPKEP